MNITIVQGAFLPVPPLLGGAVEKTWFDLASEFVRRGHRVTYFSRRFGSLPDEETLDGIRHVRVPGFDAPRSMLMYRVMDAIYAWRVKRRLPPADIVVTNTIFLPLLLRNPATGKLYVHVARFPKGQMRLYNHAARLQTVSGAVAEAIRSEYPAMAEKVRVIPNPINSQLPPLDAGELDAPRPPCILYLGRIHPEKGLEILLRAFGKFLEHDPDGSAGWRLRLVGPVDEKRGGGGENYKIALEALCAPFHDRVDWVDFVSGDALVGEYLRASIFVYPSVAEKGETFGVAPLEAMALGCATVVSGLACFRDFVVDGETGLIFDHRVSQPEEALSGVLRHLAGDVELRVSLAKAGYAKARGFTPERVAALYLDDFATLLRA